MGTSVPGERRPDRARNKEMTLSFCGVAPLWVESSLQRPFLTELCCMTTDLFLEPRWEKIIVVQFAKTFFQLSDQIYVIREARTCKDSARTKSAGFLGQPERETLASGHSGQPLRAGNSTDSEEIQNGTVRTQE